MTGTGERKPPALHAKGPGAAAPPLCIPADGLDAPVFKVLGDGHVVNVILVWATPLSEAEADAALQIVQSWLADETLWRGCDAPGQIHAFVQQTAFNSAALVFTLVNTAHPRKPLKALVARLAKAGVTAREQLFGVLEWVSGQPSPLRPPDAKPLVDVDSMAEFWRAAFDLRGRPLDSESDRECQERPAEMRLSRLEIPGLRLVYTTPTPNFLPPSARSKQVTRVLREHVAKVFCGLAAPRARGQHRVAAPIPQLLDRKNRAAPSIERIARSGRCGYSLAVRPEDLLEPLPRELFGESAYRYREHELLTALGAGAAKLGLAPVIFWRRFEGDARLDHFEIQLWEKLEAQASRASREELVSRREAVLAKGTLAIVPVAEQIDEPTHRDLTRSTVAGLPKGSLLWKVSATGALALEPVALAAPKSRERAVPLDAHRLWFVRRGAPAQRLRIPPSPSFAERGLRGVSGDGRFVWVGTSTMVRSVDLADGRSAELLQGFGYTALQPLTGSLALVHAYGGECDLDVRDPDVQALNRKYGRPTTAGSRVQSPAALYLVDASLARNGGSCLVQSIPCQAASIRAVAGGRAVIVWTNREEGWRTAVLGLHGSELHLLARFDEAMPDVFEVKGRIVSTNDNELLSLDRALARMPKGSLDLDEISPNGA